MNRYEIVYFEMYSHVIGLAINIDIHPCITLPYDGLLYTIDTLIFQKYLDHFRIFF